MENDGCAFCRIIAGTSPASILYRDAWVVAFRDAHPVAPIHDLIAPVRHIASLDQVQADEESLLGQLLIAARMVAAQEGLSQGGYRIVLNTGQGAGQSVFHMHLHMLGGRAMHWPPG